MLRYQGQVKTFNTMDQEDWILLGNIKNCRTETKKLRMVC